MKLEFFEDVSIIIKALFSWTIGENEKEKVKRI